VFTRCDLKSIEPRKEPSENATMTRTIQVQLPEPHSDLQRLIMNAAFIPDLQEMWIACGTKFGKTLAGVGAYCALFPVVDDGIFRHVAPIYKQARIGMRYAQRMLPGKPHIKVNQGNHTITWTNHNKQQILEYWHGRDAESLEGDGVCHYLFDEVAKMKASVLSSAETTTTVTRGLKMGTSTPRGKNHFYVKCMEAKEVMDWCLKKGRNPTKIFISAPTRANPFVPQESIDDARKNLPDRLFRQFYEAEFVDHGDTFPFFRQAVQGELLIFEGESQLWFDEKRNEYGSTYVGADWGKHDDFTVFTAFCAKRRKLIGFMRFRGVDYITAMKNLVWFCGSFEGMDMLRHDKTGLGEVIDDALAETGLPYEGIVFTNKSKSHMVNGLMLAFQRKAIVLPYWETMAQELDAYEVTVSEVGNWKYAAADGFHDDIVSSMILGWSLVEEFAPTDMQVISLDQLQDISFDTDKFSITDSFDHWRNK